jgi:hypothetical protein
MNIRLACVMVAVALIFVCSPKVSADIGKIGPPVFAPPQKKVNPKFEYYRYLFPKNSRDLGNGWVKIGKKKKIKVLWRLMPDPPPPKEKKTGEDKGAEKKEAPKAAGIPGLMGVPGLGR